MGGLGADVVYWETLRWQIISRYCLFNASSHGQTMRAKQSQSGLRRRGLLLILSEADCNYSSMKECLITCLKSVLRYQHIRGGIQNKLLSSNKSKTISKTFFLSFFCIPKLSLNYVQLLIHPHPASAGNIFFPLYAGPRGDPLPLNLELLLGHEDACLVHFFVKRDKKIVCFRNLKMSNINNKFFGYFKEA
jgi:hypothetical protein